MPPGQQDRSVAVALNEVRARIVTAAGRAGRDPAAVTLVVVSKTVAAARVAEAIAAGATDLGENRVQEAAGKRAELPRPGLRWHLIGHLQTNKAARAAELFDMIHSVDSLRLAQALAQRRRPDTPALPVLLEVELTGIPSRTGASPERLPALARAVLEMPELALGGLMTMAPQGPSPLSARPWFARLRALRDELAEQLGTPLGELSMGMSDDFEVAVEEGSTLVRVGRAIFGDRARGG